MSAIRLPEHGDRILVLRREWLQMILDGDKTMEVRSMPLKAGVYFLGCNGIIHGSCMLGDAVRIDTRRHWRSLFHHHRVSGYSLPYKRTFGLPVSDVRRARAVRYLHPRGAIGLVKFRQR